MKKKILFFSYARSDFGIICNLIKKFKKKYDVLLIIGSNHLDKKFGNTIKEIKENKLKYEKVNLQYSTSSNNEVLNNICKIVIQVKNKIKKKNISYSIVLGDRYEMLASSIVCLQLNIPIIHLCGGSITEGSLDNQYRYCISNMASYHFVETIHHKKNLLKSNIHKNIFISGSPSLEFNKSKLITKKKFESKYGFQFENKRIIIACFQPNTKISVIKNIFELNVLIDFLNKIPDKIIFTYPNADVGFKYYISEINKKLIDKRKVLLIKSLGKYDYFSALKFSDILVGNSSSGIIESASFQIPTINLGNRQKGRFKPKNVFDCSFAYKNLIKIYNKIKNLKKNKSFKSLKNPYFRKDTNNFIIDTFKKNIDE